ncbi:unnamed protein product [Rangifer tarandus platyrhynchus]|uniref:Uncharacterized protein n=2 Tax=Rangifer tarandus platyrhynchus TaxID=3082113 RepID=A0AC59Y2K3_RANTA|nr:unnamed protein product [Rangifer tarandus platyrhynchus]
MQRVAGMRALPANAILSQFQPAAGGYFVPAVPQSQGRPPYYTPNQLAQMRPNPRWQQGGRPQGFQGMPSAIRQSGPRPALRHLAPTGVATAVQTLAPRAAVAAAAPRAGAPYKYTSSVHSPHPAIQPLQAPLQGPLTASMLAAAAPRSRSRSRCWVNVCSHSSRQCTRTWLGR